MEKMSFKIKFYFLTTLLFGLVKGDILYYPLTEESGTNVFVANILKDANIATKVNDTRNLEFSLLSTGAAKSFFIDAKNGSIYTNESLDRDRICQYERNCFLSLEVVAKSPASEFFQIIKINIELLDINDNRPSFPKPTVRMEISEDAAINTSFSLDGAVDLDAAQYSVQRYEIATGNIPFTAEADRYPDGRSMLRLIVTDKLDREVQSFYQIQIFAYDGGTPPYTGSLVVELDILDVNDVYPAFSRPSYNATIDDSSETNTFVVKVTAYDDDMGQNGEVGYRIQFGQLHSSEIFQHFHMNSTTGVLSVLKPFDANTKDSFKIVIEAYDKAKQPLTSQVPVYVKIRDTFNDYPVININVLSDSNVAEVSEHATFGSVIAHVAVNDPDSGANGLVTCTVASDDFAIQIFENDENEYKITVAASFNRELQDRYDVTVTCSDAGSPPRVTDSMFMVQILDENDHTPKFLNNTYYVHVLENNKLGMHIIDVSALDYDIDINKVLTYSVGEAVKTKSL